MSWADSLRPGSFRGVPFKFMDAGGTGGRRGPFHLYAKRDEGFFEDLGAITKTFTLNVVTVGADYAANRDRLIAACDKKGTGLLVHPLRGRLMVACTECNWHESTKRGGVAEFALTFVVSGSPASAALGKADTQGAVGAAADGMQIAAPQAFAGRFSIAGQPGFIAAAAQQNATSALGAVQGAVRQITAASTAPFALARQVAGAVASLATLVAQPLALAGTIAGIVRGVALMPGLPAGGARDALTGRLTAGDPIAADALAIASLLDNPAVSATIAVPDSASAIDEVRKAFLSLSTLDAGFVAVPGAPPPFAVVSPPLGGSSARQAQGVNLAALLALVRQIALCGAARATSQADFVAQADALAARDDIAARFDAELLAADDDDLYTAMVKLRLAVVRDLTTRALQLPQLVTFTPSTTLPAIVIAQRLYDDPTRADEIADRNGITNPGFVLGGQPLQVLSNV